MLGRKDHIAANTRLTLNPWRAELILGNTIICLHFSSVLNAKMGQVVEMLPNGR